VPVYVALPLALVASAVVALAFAALGAVALDFLVEKLHRTADLGDAILVYFLVAPSIAVLVRILPFYPDQLASRDRLASSDVLIFVGRNLGPGVGT
jgi:hypothetical protein